MNRSPLASETRPGAFLANGPGGEKSQSAKSTLWVVLAVLTILYSVLIWIDLRRPLWYDELFTYYSAKAPTLSALLHLSRNVDINPPEIHLLTRTSLSLFGDNRFAARAPSIVAFYFAGLILFAYVRRKAGNAYAAIAVLLLYYSPAFRFATEARPYALILVCFATLLLAWDSAVKPGTMKPGRTRFVLAGIWVANTALIAAHVLAPLSLLPFLVAESVRFWRYRSRDYSLWAALTLPLAFVCLYLPLFSGYRRVLFPAAFQAGVTKILRFYDHGLFGVADGLALALLVALIATSVWKSAPRPSLRVTVTPEEIALFSILILNPALLNLLFRLSHGAFWDRYAITTSAALYLALALFLGYRFSSRSLPGYAAALAILLVIVVERILVPLSQPPPPQNAAALATVRPDLPLVAASGLTFLEMDHNEDARLVSRLFYLEDRASAVRYTHSTIFEQMDLLKASFPVRGTVMQLPDFVRQHPQFLVFGGGDVQAEDWILRKLADTGAGILNLGAYVTPYKASTLYLVTLPVQ